MVSLMQNEGETDDRKITITLSSENFSTPSESRICRDREKINFFQFITNKAGFIDYR